MPPLDYDDLYFEPVTEQNCFKEVVSALNTIDNAIKKCPDGRMKKDLQIFQKTLNHARIQLSKMRKDHAQRINTETRKEM